MRVAWTVWTSNQSILKEMNPEYSLEGLMLKLKLQYFSHLMQRADSLEKTLMQGKIKGKRRRGQQRMRWLDGIKHIKHEFEQTLGDGEGQISLVCCSPWGHKDSDMSEQLYNNNKISEWWNLPGSSIVRTLSFHCRGCRFHPWSGN